MERPVPVRCDALRLARQRLGEGVGRLQPVAAEVEVMRERPLGGVTQDGDELGLRHARGDPLGGVRAVEVQRRRLAARLLPFGPLEQRLVGRGVGDGAAVQALAAGPARRQRTPVVGEEARLLHRAHEHRRVLAEVVVQRGRARFRRADDEERGEQGAEDGGERTEDGETPRQGPTAARVSGPRSAVGAPRRRRGRGRGRPSAPRGCTPRRRPARRPTASRPAPTPR